MKAKLTNALIVVPILVGTVVLTGMAGMQAEGKVVPFLFLGFFGLIVAVQIIPALMLVCVLLKEIFSRTPQEGKEPGASVDGH